MQKEREKCEQTLNKGRWRRSQADEKAPSVIVKEMNLQKNRKSKSIREP